MIKIRHLRLRSITSQEVFGTDISFSRGLNIIQAPNTSGKSTCLQSVIYALGLERSLGPQLAIPLPYAMRERIHAAQDNSYQNVIESYVELEIENSSAEVLVVHRDVVGGTNSKLIRTWRGPTLSEGTGAILPRDFYVLDGGSAVNESGFHFFLSHFIGWELPFVTRYEGNECPLYLETIFPMLFVEQKRGWSTVQGPFPTFFRIQDVARRVMEFLLDLEAAKNRRIRAELRSAQTELANKWNESRKSFEESAARVGRMRGVPNSPTAEFALAPTIELQMFYEDEWMSIEQVLALISAKLSELEAAQVETVEEAAPKAEARIEVLRLEIDQQLAIIEAVRNEFASESQDLRALEARLSALESDLRKNQDAKKLQTLGSELGNAASEQICPTCHQGVSSELLPTIDSVGMALDENILFVKSQIELYKSAMHFSRDRVSEISARYRGVDQALKSKQQEIRSLRQDLVRPSTATSRSTIEQIVRLQAYSDSLKSVADLALSLTDSLKHIASQWATVVDGLKGLPSDELTISDKRKLAELEKQLRQQLTLYGFRSFQPAELSLSGDNFRPLVKNVDRGETIEKEINFEISASDGIRLKWAYYLSILELKNIFQINQPGLLIFDEPGQQEMDEKSLLFFLYESLRVSKGVSQVIVSTSDAIETIMNSFGAVENTNVVSFPGFILQPVKRS